MGLDFPPIFLLPTHLQPSELHALEDSISSLTYDISEAEVVLGKISRGERARFELRRLKLDTEPLPVKPASTRSSPPKSDDEPGRKRRKTSGPAGKTGAADEAVGCETDGHEADRHPASPVHLADRVKVVRLAWLTDSLERNAVLPVQDYLLYEGRKLPPPREPDARPVTASGSSIIARAEKGMAGRKETSHGKQLQHTHGHAPPPPLIRETTSEHDQLLPPVPEFLNTRYSCQRPTLLNPPNAAFVEELNQIRTHRVLQGDQVGVRAYSSSIATLRAYPYVLQTSQEVARLPGCGAKIAELYQQWKDAGQLKEASKTAADPMLCVLKLFYNIWGVGDTTARELYKKGWRDLDDLVEYAWGSLSRVQQIGVKYYDEFQLQISRTEVEAIASIILDTAQKLDAGFQMTIVGGYRRGKKDSGDVDVVLSHPDAEWTLRLIERLVMLLEKSKFITHTLTLSTRNSERDQKPLAWKGEGGKGSGFCTLDKALVVWQDRDRPDAPHRRVDIIVSPWKTVGCAVLGWSGGTTFQRDLRLYCKREKGLKFDSSGIRSRTDGAWVDLEGGGSGAALDMATAEKRVFAGLGLHWRPPEERCTG